ncbi:MAG: hypothetical protein DPW11_00680 [bacterium]|nr:hypothetical protein [Candidatus Microgenomates bacterium CPR3]MCQ3944283.1 hypothetical protein [bacterium]RIK52047.1 MAG: hypothetical protein DCC61_00555 [Candidatus Microgenomates bacterium]
MKIVFIASAAQKDELGTYYEQIVNELKSQKIDVFTGHLFSGVKDSDLVENQQIESWYKEITLKVRNADAVFVELSYPSTVNVGHILTEALDSGKPVVALYKVGREPFFLRGRVDDKLVLLEYHENDIQSVVKSALEYISTAQDVRFNFFISPRIGRYLDWISKNKRVPRAVYLRRLIEEDMRSNKEYNEGTDE